MNITTKICLGATILFSIVGIVIGFSKKGAISSLKEKYDQAKVAENQLTSKNTKIISLQNDLKTVTVERDRATSKLATTQQDSAQARTDQKAAEGALTIVNEDHDATKAQLESAKNKLTKALADQRRWLVEKNVLEKEIVKLKKRRGGKGIIVDPVKPLPLREGVEGKVVVNNANQFVIIDIGKNKGLTRGAILEVWDGAIFIGKILVVDPEPMGNPAVAIANIDSGATTGTIAKGHVVKLVNP